MPNSGKGAHRLLALLCFRAESFAMRSTTKTLLVTAVSSLLVVGCEKEQADSNSSEKDKPGEAELQVKTPVPKEKPSEPSAEDKIAKTEPVPKETPPEPKEKPSPPIQPEKGEPARADGQLSKEVKALRQRANTGEIEAQLRLGDKYSSGEGAPRDFAQAAIWYRKAAEQGDPNAQYNLGMLYQSGSGVAKDDEEADKWFRLADESQKALIEKPVEPVPPSAPPEPVPCR